MGSESVEFASRYAAMNAEELLAAARDYEELAATAQAELRAEFAKRGMEAPLVEDNDAVSQRKLVTLRQYRDLSEAIVARSMLEASGIEVYLRDENLVRLDWQVSNFIGGIRLQVEEAEAETARELLSQSVPEFIRMEGEPDYAQPHCPVCGSVEITFEGSDRTFALPAVFVVGLPLPPGPKTWLCSVCGTRWEDGQ